ncbi:hydantoinase B/oxoprolinase family protein [Pseudonocardia sp. Cha107L01]|uniref:hydantoinase B/oxoprolinase family protein n=1 Tax=Pseudonocardia sp. Cha107L01 TaxID=3457576 RepID=UPI00403E4D20
MLVDDIWRIIEANIRVPELVLNDIRCFIAACNRSDERVQDLVARYGLGSGTALVVGCPGRLGRVSAFSWAGCRATGAPARQRWSPGGSRGPAASRRCVSRRR